QFADELDVLHSRDLTFGQNSVARELCRQFVGELRGGFQEWTLRVVLRMLFFCRRERLAGRVNTNEEIDDIGKIPVDFDDLEVVIRHESLLAEPLQLSPVVLPSRFITLELETSRIPLS